MASWADIAATIPPDHGDDREAAIVQAVRAGHFVPPEWAEIRVTEGPVSMVALVATEPLRLGDESDSVIPMVDASTAQAIADLLDARLPSSKLLDAANEQAGCFVDFAQLMGDPADMSTERMIAQSRKIDQLFDACPPGVLRSTPGKQWVPSPKLANPAQFPDWGKDTACNYGGYTKAPIGENGKRPWRAISTDALRIWQPQAYRHNTAHTDYSQVAPQLIAKSVILSTPAGDLPRTIDEIALNPATAALVSAEGPMVLRYPWLPTCSAIDQGGDCTPGGDPPELPPGGETPPFQPPPPTPAKKSNAAIWALGVGAAVAALYYLLGE